ncbi:hypothetical protein ACC738_38635 [Rhizobium ruizarguesonis]
MFSALADEPGEFAAQTHSFLSTRSPTSLKLALRLIREGAKSAISVRSSGSRLDWI